MAELPRFEPGAPPEGRRTNIDLKGIAADATRRSDQANAQANLSMAELSQQLLNRSQKSFQNAQRIITKIPELDNAALKARNKSRAMGIVQQAKLDLDKQLQEMERNPEIDPLVLGETADKTIQSGVELAVKQASALGPEMQAYVREKMGAFRVDKVPEFRTMGYKKETDDMVAAVEQRNFIRQSEMNEPGTTAGRKLELADEMIADLENLRGIHITDQEFQKQVEGIVLDTQEHQWFELLEHDPMAALKALATSPFSPEKRNSLRNTALAVINGRLSMADAARRRQEFFLNKRRDKLMNASINKISESEGAWDPRVLLNDPTAAGTLRKGEMQQLVKYRAWWIKKQQEPKRLTVRENLELAELAVRARSGEMDAEGFNKLLTHRLSDRDLENVTWSQMSSLIGMADSAFKANEGIDRSFMDKERRRGESYVNDWFDPIQGPFAALSERFGTQIRLSKMNALSQYNAAINAKLEEAKQIGAEPSQWVNAESIAFDVLRNSLTATMPMYKQYIKSVDNKALAQQMVPNMETYDPISFNRILVQEHENGNLSQEGLKAARSFHNFMTRMKELPTSSTQTGQPHPMGASPSIPAVQPTTQPTTANKNLLKLQIENDPFTR